MNPTTVGANLYHSSKHNVICFLYLLLLNALVSGHGICLHGELASSSTERCKCALSFEQNQREGGTLMTSNGFVASQTVARVPPSQNTQQDMSISNHSTVALK
jgi:hypothetical protein